MEYQLISNSQCVLRIDENGVVSTVPNDPMNRDWIDYQTWLTGGNTPLAAQS